MPPNAKHASEETPLLLKSQFTRSLTLSDRSLTEEISDSWNNDEEASFYYQQEDDFASLPSSRRRILRKLRKKAATVDCGVVTLTAIIVVLAILWCISLVKSHYHYYHHGFAPSTTSNTTTPQHENEHVLPGNATWLGKGKMLDDAPIDFESFLPLVYVLMGGPSPFNRTEATAIPRIILEPDGTHKCPQLVLQQHPTSNSLPDLKANEIPPVTLRGVGDMELPHAFPIKICETRLETRAQKEAWNRGMLTFEEGLLDASKPIIQIPTDPQRVLIMGDTGLRSKASDLGLGHCNGPKLYGIPQCDRNFTKADLKGHAREGSFQSLEDWPLPDIMTRAADVHPDLVINIGDYLYRQSPCPANNTAHADCAGINVGGMPENFANPLQVPNDVIINFVPGHWGDNWFGWWADFFYPALPLLAQAPMIALRGNHENCERAGYGYFFLLSTQPYHPKAHKGGSWCLDYSPPFAVPFEKEQYLVLDDSIIEPKAGGIDDFNFTEGACPGPPTDGSLVVPAQSSRYDDLTQDPDEEIEPQISIFSQYMQDIKEMSMLYETNFYLSHRPIFAVACNGDQMSVLDWTMQQSLQADTLDRVVAMFGGHMHWLHVLEFVNQTLPTQVVVGHGGTQRIPNYVDQDIYPHLQLEVGEQDHPMRHDGSSGPLFTARVERGMTDSSMYGFAVMNRDVGNTEDYHVSFLSLNRTTTPEGNEVVREVVELDYHVTIPRKS